MTRAIILFITLALAIGANGQVDVSYLKANAIQINSPEKLSEKIYKALSPFQVIMCGEMHGTNESAPFVKGLADLFTTNGDSVQVGLEIAPELMSKFLKLRTDSSVYQSEFFAAPPYLDGKESSAWADLIASLNRNPKVAIFLFDTGRNDNIDYRDSLMAMNMKRLFSKRPSWRMIALCGNYHNRISDPANMISVFKRNVNAKVCSLNMAYKEGTCMASFSGEGFKMKELGSYPSVYNSTEGYDQYFILFPVNSNQDYDGIYYTRNITAANIISLKR